MWIANKPLVVLWKMFWWKYGRVVAFIASAAFAFWILFGHC